MFSHTSWYIHLSNKDTLIVPTDAKNNALSTSPREHYLRHLAIPFCDHQSVEFHKRFNPESRKGTEILALLPGIIKETGNVQLFVDGLIFWESDMPNVSSLRAELKEWQRYLRITEPTQSSSSPNLTDCLEHVEEEHPHPVEDRLHSSCWKLGRRAFIPLPATGQNLPRQQNEGRSAFWAHCDEHEPRHGD